MKEDKKRVKDILSAFSAPIVYEPGGWGEDVPDWLPNRIIAERLALIDADQWDRATDAEITAHLYTAALNHPLDHDWAEIAIFLAAKQIPGLYETGVGVPESLTEYQEHLLNQLKFDIRRVQIRKEKEKMPDYKGIKVVLEAREDGVIIGVQRPEKDPFIRHYDCSLDESCLLITTVIEEADKQWTQAPRNPAYSEPKTAPKKTTSASPVKPQLEAKEKPQEASGPPAPAQVSEAEQVPPAQTEPVIPELPALEEEIITDEAPVPEEETIAVKGFVPGTVEATEDQSQVQAEPEAEISSTDTVPQGSGTIEVTNDEDSSQGETEPAPVPADAAIHAPVQTQGEASMSSSQQSKIPASGSEKFYLASDPEKKYDSIQQALDALDVPKEKRPNHNRYARLSGKLRQQILSTTPEKYANG